MIDSPHPTHFGGFPTPSLSPTEILIRLEAAERTIQGLNRRVADLEAQTAAINHATAWADRLKERVDGAMSA